MQEVLTSLELPDFISPLKFVLIWVCFVLNHNLVSEMKDPPPLLFWFFGFVRCFVFGSFKISETKSQRSKEKK